MKKYLAASLCVAATLTPQAFGGKFNPTLSIGDPAPTWSGLPGVDDKQHSLDDLQGKQVVVVVFTCNSCPYAVDYEDRLIQFAANKGDDVGLVAVNVNKVDEDLLPAMKQRAEAKGFNFPYLFDESQKIAKDFGATRTPEFFVFDKNRRVAYMGAMDDSSAPDGVKETYLKDAVEALLAGKEPEVKETPPVGCAIRFERKRSRRSK
jgi:peroxiredoxin